jgi:hypothetical protein
MALSQLNILIVGATGNLGSLITKECLDRPELIVHTLVFDKNQDKCLCDEVTKAGGKCIQADITKPETFKGVTKGMHTVISTVLGSEDVFFKGQLNLLHDCIENGVKRFIPSTFTIDVWDLPFGEHKFIDNLLTLRKRIDESNVRGVYVSHGIFMETYFWFIKKYGFFYFGDINQKINLTSQENVAEIVSVVVCNPDRVGDVKIFADEMSTKQLLDLYNTITNQKLDAKCLGSLNDLKNKKWEKSQQDFGMELLCGFLLPVFDGRGRIKDSNNDEFGEVKMLRVEEFLKRSQGKGFNYEFPIVEMAKKFEQILGK